MSNFNLVKIRVDYQDAQKKYPNQIFDDHLHNPKTGLSGKYLKDLFLTEKDYKTFKKNNPDFPDICYDEIIVQINLIVNFRITNANNTRNLKTLNKTFCKFLSIKEKLFMFFN